MSMLQGASTFLNRAKQLASENLSDGPKTQYSPELLQAIHELEKTREWTEKVLKRQEELIQPNPALRAESFIHEAFDMRKPEKMTISEALGTTLENAAAGIDECASNYTKGLKQFGQSERFLGQSERAFARKVQESCITPMRKFLSEEIAAAFKEKSSLDTIRLDLDVAKNKAAKAKSDADKEKANKELEEKQKEFDRQSDFAKVVISRTVNNHHRDHASQMKEFHRLQLEYFKECTSVMDEMEGELKKVDF